MDYGNFYSYLLHETSYGYDEGQSAQNWAAPSKIRSAWVEHPELAGTIAPVNRSTLEKNLPFTSAITNG